MASGLIKVVLVMANLIGILPADSSTYTVLGYAADAALYFMPILIGYTAAKKFGADPSLAMGLCALLVYPNLMTALGGETPVTIFGLPVYNATYTNMMFPSIMVVFVMNYVERFFKKYVPEILRVMLVPLGTFLVMLPLSLCLVAPAGVFLGNGITWLVETNLQQHRLPGCRCAVRPVSPADPHRYAFHSGSCLHLLLHQVPV